MVSELEEPDEIAEAFLAAGVGTIVLKLGKNGCLIRTNPEKRNGCTTDETGAPESRLLIPAVPGIRPMDTTGAGDTFAAAFLSSILEGKPLRECGEYANAAAAVTIREFGATTALKDREQIEEMRSCRK